MLSKKDALDAAQKALAQARVDKAQADVDAQQKIVDEAQAAYDAADRSLQEATLALNNKIVERDAAKAKADAAYEAYMKAKTEKDSLESAIKDKSTEEMGAEIEQNKTQQEMNQAKDDLHAAEQAQEEAKAEKDKADAITQQKKNELDAAKKELDDFKATVSAAGSKGFFESLGFTKDIFSQGEAAGSTQMGNAKDATNLDNMLKSLDFIDKCNEIRRHEGLNEMKVSLTLMAYAQYNANGSAYTFDHLRYWGCSENLVWGTTDPEVAFESWYTDEKKLYEQDKNNAWQCLHYLSIINPDNVITGIGLSRYNAECVSQTFLTKEESGVTYYTTVELRELILRYLSGGDLKDAYEKAQEIYEQAAASSDAAGMAYSNAVLNTLKLQSAYDQKVKANEDAVQKVENLRNELKDLTKQKKQAEDAMENNQEILTLERNNQKLAEDAIEKLENTVSSATAAADSTKSTLDSQTKTLDSLKAELKKLQDVQKDNTAEKARRTVGTSTPADAAQKLEEAIAEALKAGDAYDEAVKLLAKEQATLNSMTQVADEKQAIVDQLNEQIAQLRKDMEAKKADAEMKKAILSEKEQVLVDAQAALEAAKEQKVRTAEILNEKTKKADQAKAVYDAAKASLDAYNAAQDALKTAQADTVVARNTLKVARELANEKAQAVTDTQKAHEKALERLKRSNALSLESAMKAAITDEEYKYLNAYVTKIETTKQAYTKALEELDAAKAVTAKAKASYDKEAVKHAETIADLTIAKANYQKFVDTEKKAETEKAKADKTTAAATPTDARSSVNATSTAAATSAITNVASNAVKTGDLSQTGLMMSLLAGSFGTLGVLRRRRKNNQKK